MAYSSAPCLVMLLSVITVASLLANTHAAAATLATNNDESYLYITSDSPPVLEHGKNGIDFFKSTSKPKVVEFYNPKCGACQAFKSNYIEIAKKVQSQKPNVEFYGVSCELYQSICDKYGPPSVPKIFAFPNGARVEPDDGIEVPKGAGTIYFLSARLIKALRSPEEIASDVAKLKEMEEVGGGGVEEQNVELSSRRLEDSVSGDEEGQVSEEDDEEEDSDNDDAITVEEDIVSGDDSGDDSVVSEDVEEEDKGQSYGSEDLLSEDNRGGGSDATEELSEDKDEESEDIVKRRPPPAVRDGTPPSNGSQNRHQAAGPSSSQDGTPEKQIQQQQQHPPSSKKSQDNPDNKKNKLYRSEHVRHTDAYKNTVREFEKMDEQKGKPKGYHYNKMKEEREAHFNNVRDAQKIAAQQVPSVRHQQQQQQQQSVRGSTPTTEEREAKFNKVKAENEKRKAENDKRLRDARAFAAEKFAGSRQDPVGGTPTEGEARGERISVAQGEQVAGYRQSIRGNKPFTNDGQPTNSGPIPIVGKPRGQVDEPQNPVLPPHDQIAVGGDHFVNPFSADPEKAKKFNEYLARRKQKLERQEKLKHPIKSIIGGAMKGTEDEKEDISAIHAKKSPMRNYKSQYHPQPPRPAPGLKKADLRPEAQHKTIGQKVLKKIPIVNRAFKRSKGEETLNDAALSFTRGLLMGVFKNNVPLDYKRRTALVDWLDLLRVSLPPEIGLHELIDTLKYDIDKISQRQENLLEVINKHPLPDHQWSNECTKGTKSGGFFCGFWKLLHVMSVGFAEQAGGLALQEASPSIRVFSPHEAGDVVREYMAFFFNCEKCSTRFIGKYDDCSFDRCRLLGDETVGASEETWQQFPLWLWQVHNEISISKLDRASEIHTKLGRKAEAKKWELSLKAVYPHVDQCISCVTQAGTWKLNRVYRHLEKEYWTFGSEASLDPKMEKFLKHTDIERGNVSYGLGVYIFAVLLALLALFAKKYRIRATGRHKKDESLPVERFPRKYRDS